MRFSLFLSILLFIACENKPQPTAAVEKKTEPMSEEKYNEKYRPQYHFSPTEKWMNDPNGMVYFDGEYHLFYQYHPESTVWGPMHWGHAVSKNMLHWEHLPVALYPDDLGTIFSGSAVADVENTSGFGEDDKTPLVAIFTHHDAEKEKTDAGDHQVQSLAYSTDKGRTWTKYAGNPVLPNAEKIRDYRDPKVIWDEARNQWLMVLAAKDRLRFYASKNLKDWTYLSDFGNEYGDRAGVWECPDIFPLRVEGSDAIKYVLILSLNPGAPNGGSGTQYFVGDWNGKEFIIDPAFEKDIQNGKGVWMDYGRDNYAGVTWSNIDPRKGRRLFLGWMSNWDYAREVPIETWRGAMTIPRTLTLHKTAAGYRLQNRPVREVEYLAKASHSLPKKTFANSYLLTGEVPFKVVQSRIQFTIDRSKTTAQEFGLRIFNKAGEEYRVGYDAKTKRFFSDRTESGDLGFSDKFAAEKHNTEMLTAGQETSENADLIKFDILLDRASAETFINDGSIAVTDIFFPNEEYDRAEIFALGGEAKATEVKIFEMRSVWQ